MKPTVILTTTTSPDYLYCLPITAKTWELQGWYPQATVIGEGFTESVGKYMPKLSWVDTYRVAPLGEETFYSQCYRLFDAMQYPMYGTGGDHSPICIGDVDMLLGSDFLYRRFDQVNVFGHDLTGFDQVPMCYVTGTTSHWCAIMQYESNETFSRWLTRMIAKHNINLSDPHQRWIADQTILTAQLKEYGFDKIKFHPRGVDQATGLPLGRIDRYNNLRIPAGPIHDVHLPRKPWERLTDIKAICELMYPAENWEWLVGYTEEFKKENQL